MSACYSLESDIHQLSMMQQHPTLQMTPISTLTYPSQAGFVTVVAAPWGQSTSGGPSVGFCDTPMSVIHGDFYAPFPMPGDHCCGSGSRASPRSKSSSLSFGANACGAMFTDCLVQPYGSNAWNDQKAGWNDRRPRKADRDDSRGTKRPQKNENANRDAKRQRSEVKSRDGSGLALSRPTSALPEKFDSDKASRIIWEYYKVSHQIQSVYVDKIKLRDSLFAIVKNIFPYCGLYVIGSSMNGFGSSSSDMDLCLMLSHSQIDQRKDATNILKVLERALSKCDFLDDLKLIHAKVPILKFRTKNSNIECDLNINNSVGIRNTHLLNAYSTMDCRVAALVLCVKRWAKVQNINDASQGTISSYSLVLMVIHYLQYGCTPFVIPSLQQKYPHKFDSKVDVRTLSLNEKLAPYKSPNYQSVGELFVGFLNYYANVFKFDGEVISVRLGRTIPVGAVHETNESRFYPNQWKCLCIEEPFNLSNTAYSVFDPSTFQRILNVVRQSFLVVQQSGSIESIMSSPLRV